MTQTERWRNELEVANRIAGGVSDAGSTRAIRRYIGEIEAKLLRDDRPRADTSI